jgi:hypothetical protein
MDVTKLPAPGAAATQTPTIPPGEPGSQSPANIAPIGDRADIRPLDVQAALQILLAEVRASFDLQAVLMSGDGGVVLGNPAQAARAVVEIVVQSMPDGLNVPVWTAALARAEAALQIGFERAIDIVTVWHDVQTAVVDAVKETRTSVFAVLGDEPQNSIWARPEWALLAPRLERFRRRRRIARRRLTDPDYSMGVFDDDDEHRS